MSDLKLDDVTSILDDEEKPAFRPLSVDDVNSAIMDLSAERTQRSVFEGVQKNPDTYAKDRKTADRAGLPVDAVEYDRTTVENSLKIEDVMGALGEAPVTSAFMQDRDNAAIAHDDVQNLTALEKAWNWYTDDYWPGVFDVARSVPAGVARMPGMALSGIGEAGLSLRRLSSRGINAILGDGTIENLDYNLPAWADPAKWLVEAGGVAKEGADVLAPEERNFATDVGEGLGQIAAQITIAVLTGGAGSSSSLLTMFGQGADIQAEMVNEAGADSAGADIAILGGGAITAITEKFGLEALLKHVPAKVKGRIFQVLAGAGSEGSQEIMEQVLQNLAAFSLYNPDQEIFDPSVLYEGGVGATVGGIVSAALGIKDIGRMRRAQDAVDRLKESNQTALQSKLNDRDPERAGLHRAEVLRAKGIESVAIDAEAANTFFQSALLEDPDLADRLGITEEGLAEALAMGGDIEIGVDAFARHLYGTPAFDQIADHVRLGPDAMTAAEAMQYEETGLQDEIARFEDSIAAMEDGPRQAADVISQEVEAMMLEAGQEADTARFAGVLLASEYSTVAERAGIDALALWRQDRVSILGPDTAPDTTVDELSILLDKARSGSDAETFLELSATPMLDELKARGGVDPNGPLGMELKALELPAQMKRGLFKEGGLQSADNIPQNEVGLFAEDDFGEDMNGYIPPDAIVEAVRAEIAGEPKRTGTQQADVEAFNAGVNDLTQALDEAGLTLDSPDADIRAALNKVPPLEQPEGVGFGPRGSISFDAKETVIRMYEAADRSTFLHEAGHLFLEHVKRNSDRWGLRNPQFTEDWDTVRKWWGDNAESLRAEAIKYARQQKDDAAVTALGKMSEKEVRDYVSVGNLTGTAFEQAPTQTDAFKNWFGDSKVVDKNGKPLVVYHGTPDTRAILKYGFREGIDGGIFFTSDRRVAETYADDSRAWDYQNAEPYNLAVYLSIKNPKIIDARGAHWRDTSAQVEAAKEDGHDGIIIRNTIDEYNSMEGEGGRSSDVYVVFSPNQAKSAMQGRGTSRIDGADLGEIGNAGTFDPNDPRILYQGRTGAIPDSDPHGYLTRAMHEQWARGSEDYFKSGQAPSVGLQDAFNRFRAWLVSIYNRLSGRGTLDVRFSEPVRRVMDRLLATDEEIALVEEQYDLKALFASAEEAGMTPAQWAAYQRETARAAEDAKTRQLKKHLREIEREQLQWWKEESQRVRETEVEPEIQAQPVYKALYALARGSMPDGSEIPGGLRPSRLDRKAVVAVLENEESLSRLPKVGRTGILATGKEQGAHPDVIASLYGYPDGRAMLIDLMNAKPMEQAIRGTVEARMKERHGDLTQHAQATEAALESAHADKRGDVLAMELNALRESGPKMKPAFVRQWARERIATQKVGQIQPQRYLAAERKYAREAGKLLRQGDRLGAQRAKFKQLLNFYMAKEAYAERDRIEKDRRYMSKFNRVKKTFKAIDPEYVDKIRKILAIHELGPRLSDKKALVLEMKALNDWIQAKQQDDGAILEIPPQILAANEKTHYRDMTLEDFRALADTIRNIEAQGRLKKEALVNKETRLIDDMAGEIVERLDRKPVKARAARKARFQNTGTADRVIGKLASFDAALRKVEFLLEWIDGEKGGPAHRYIFQSFADAETARNDLTKAVTAKVMGALDAIPKKTRERLAEKVDVPELGRTFRRSDLLMMALNTGNESNLTKMIEGSAKDVATDAQAWTQEGIDAALANLTKEEWDFVQTVWDSFEAMYPEVEAIYRRENGVAPEKIEPREIETRFGTYKGGYFPMMYDPERSAQARDLESKSALEAMQSSIVKGSVNSSMTKARTGFSAPVLLNIEALPNHIERTAHFITHYEAVRTVRKLLARPELARAMENRLGPESTETLRQWVNEIASNGQPTAPTSVVGRLVEAMRTNATVAIMGFSYTTGASQMLGYSQSIDALAQQPDGSYKPHKGAEWVLQGLVQYLRNPAATKRWVYEASGEMRHRFENTDRDIRHGMKKLAGKSGAWKQMQRFSLMAIAGVQLYVVDFPTWVGAYNKGLAEGRSTDDAVKYADSVLRTSQSAGGLKDLSAIQREPGVTRAFTMFYSFFNVLYNLEAQALGRTKGARDVPQLAARAAILLALPVAAEALLRNEWPDDDEDYAEWLALRAAVYAFSSVPLLRDMVGMTEGFGYSLSPLDSFGESLGKSVRDIAKAADEGEMSASGWKAVVSAFGFGFGAPATAVNRIIDAADAMQEGEDVGPYDFLVGFKE